jgi:hypothetical protein
MSSNFEEGEIVEPSSSTTSNDNYFRPSNKNENINFPQAKFSNRQFGNNGPPLMRSNSAQSHLGGNNPYHRDRMMTAPLDNASEMGLNLNPRDRDRIPFRHPHPPMQPMKRGL